VNLIPANERCAMSASAPSCARGASLIKSWQATCKAASFD
jgi:hypothetical protein